MSHEAERWARAQTVGNSTAKAVLKELAFRMNGETGLCYPSVKTLCKDLEIKKDETVLNALVRLESLGLISRTLERGERGNIIRTLFSFPTFNPEEWKVVPQKSEDGCSEKRSTGTPKIGAGYSEKRGTVLRKSGEWYSENRSVTGKLNMETEPGKEQVIKASPSDDLVLSPDTEQPKVKPKRTKTETDRPDDVDAQVWDEFLILRKQKKKTFTDLALQGMRREAKAAGITLEQAMTLCVENGWTGFKEKYVRESGLYSSTRPPQRSFNRPLSREQMALDDDF